MAQASGGQAMQSLDNDGTAYTVTPNCCDGSGPDEAALMRYDINIPSAGTYYLYVRMRRVNSAFEDDSIHVGLGESRGWPGKSSGKVFRQLSYGLKPSRKIVSTP